MKKYLIITCFLAICYLPSFAQQGGATIQQQINGIVTQPSYKQAIAGFENDAATLYKGYTEVATKSIAYLLNTGWVNTAKTKGKFPRFTLMAVFSLANIPSRANQFYLDGDKLEYLELHGNTKSRDIPTIFGSSAEEAPIFQTKPNTSVGTPQQIVFPKSGAGTNYVPIAYLQGSIGVIQGTDILFRFAPPYSVPTSDVRMSPNVLWGVGIMHSISQWFYEKKSADRSSPIHVALQFGYSQFQLNVKSNTPLIPRGINEANTVVARENEEVSYKNYVNTVLNNQEIAMNFSSMNVNIVGSISIAILTPYVSIGYSTMNTQQDVVGNYPIVIAEPGHALPITGAVNKYVVGWVTDPVSLTDNYGNLRVTLGARLKLGPFIAHVAYHNIDFNLFELGVGVDI